MARLELKWGARVFWEDGIAWTEIDFFNLRGAAFYNKKQRIQEVMNYFCTRKSK